jgi:hypothetical protein
MSEPIPIAKPARQRRQLRREWFTRTLNRFADADLVFVDRRNLTRRHRTRGPGRQP